MKFITLLKFIGFVSVIISSTTVIICVYTYFESFSLAKNGGNISIQLSKDPKITGSSNNENQTKEDIHRLVNETTENPVNPIQEKENGKEKHQHIFLISTIMRGAAVGGMFACAQIVVSAFLLTTDTQESCSRGKAWVVFAIFGTIINLVCLISSVRTHTLYLHDIRTHHVGEMLFTDLNVNYVFKYYIMVFIYMVVHAVGVFFTIFCMRPSDDSNYKPLVA